NGALFYTRAGQFSFDENNTLVDTVTGMDVMGMSDSNTLQSIDLTELRILLPEATSEIQITGNLQPTSNSEEITEISIFDVRGEAQTISLHFTNPGDSDDIWNIEVRDSDGNSLGTDSIQFSNNGSLLAGANQFNMDLTLNDVTQNISFLFGEPGSTSQTTQSINLTATLTTQNVNGSAITGLTSSIFNNEGILELTYGNGESATGPQVALATFANEGALIADAGALYTANNNNAATLGRAGDPNFGGILSGRYELSNVDLTQEFADILIIQRGFQASSRVMSVSNELIEQLYNSTQ
ncbi:MAG: flagellar biosynthesis protein FlgE, partial [Alteromonadaceae bacterium]